MLLSCSLCIHATAHLLLPGPLVVLVRKIQMPLGSRRRENHHANYTTRTAVPLNGLG